jgi:hypothetical protein
MNTNTENRSLFCDLTAIPADAREEHIVTAPQLFQRVQEVRELPNGYTFGFLNEPGGLLAIAKYIEYERLCCPFFDFELKVESDQRAVWLSLTGREGVKELLKMGLLKNLESRDDLKKLIQTGGDIHLDELVERTELSQLGNVLKAT